MTRIRYSMIAWLSIALLPATPAFADTALESLQKRVAKSAPLPGVSGFPDRPKGTCVCQQSGSFSNTGFLRHFVAGTSPNRVVQVDCAYPRFDGTGAQTGLGSCQIFVALPK